VIVRTILRGLVATCMMLIASLHSAPAYALDPSLSASDRQILVMVRSPADHYRPNGAYGGGYGDELARSARERLARRIARDYDLAFVDAWPMPLMGLDCFVMRIPDERTAAMAAEQVSRDRAVAWAQPVAAYETQGGPLSHNDPLFAAQPAAVQWRLAELHRVATGRGIRIAVIDSGIESSHPDLAGQLLIERNFVAGRETGSEEHGTRVAGIIAAKADNRLGIAGVAPEARVLGLRACWQESTTRTLCDSFSVLKALYFAIEQHADVINLSLSGPDDRILRELLNIGLARGAAIVAAFDRRRPDGGFPASVPGVIAVSNSMLDHSGGPVYIAPGRDVPTTEPGGRWFLVNGSSYAAAHVSGLVALVRQRGRSAPLSLVTRSAGGGVIDACATVLRTAADCDCGCTPSRVAVARQRP
jgi:subtilisin family serine protease